MAKGGGMGVQGGHWAALGSRDLAGSGSPCGAACVVGEGLFSSRDGALLINTSLLPGLPLRLPGWHAHGFIHERQRFQS